MGITSRSIAMRPWAEISADFEGVSAPGSPPPVQRQSGRRLRSPRWKTGDPWWAVRPREITIDGRRTVTYPVCAMAAVMGRTSATIRRWETVGILPPAPIVEPGVSWQGDRRLYRRATSPAVRYFDEIAAPLLSEAV